MTARFLHTENARRLGAVLGVAGIAFAGAAAIGLSTQIPQPMVHDEFSYLLAADTFAHGRLTNAPHPLAPSFETFHVLESPTYASKYPPAQGAFLALGGALGGTPILGVWLATAAMSAAIAWMLMAFVPRGWAVLGGLLAAAQFGVVGPWAHGEWGGAVAAMAGALALGAVARVTRHHRARDGLVLGIAVLLLANSRPYEGLLVAIPIGTVWLRDAFHRRGESGLLSRTVAPLLLVLVLGFGWMGYYNARVTDDPWTLPYTLYEERTPFPSFTFLPSREGPVEYSNERMRQQHVDYIRGFLEEPRAIPWLAPNILEGRWLSNWQFYVGWAWTLPLLALPFARRERGTALFVACVAVEMAGALLTNWSMRHYLAPMTGAVVGLVVIGLRRIDSLRIAGIPLGRAVVVGTALLTLGMALSRVDEHVQDERMWNRQRAGLVEILSKTAHDHVILVEYPKDYPVVAEWVYNSADIDAQPVVWARSLGTNADAAVAEYYPARQLWRLRFQGGAILEPHPLGRGRGPFPYQRVAGDWTPRDSWQALFGRPERDVPPAGRAPVR